MQYYKKNGKLLVSLKSRSFEDLGEVDGEIWEQGRRKIFTEDASSLEDMAP